MTPTPLKAMKGTLSAFAAGADGTGTSVRGRGGGVAHEGREDACTAAGGV